MHPCSKPILGELMRSRFSLLPLLLLLVVLPAGAYELLQKISERRDDNHGLLALSAKAEAEIPWRPRTGSWWLDHAEHELRETRRFYALLGAQLAPTANSAPRTLENPRLVQIVER